MIVPQQTKPPRASSARKRRITESGLVEVTGTDSEEPTAQTGAESGHYHGYDVESRVTVVIKGTITRLLRLSNAVRKSATASRARRIVQYTDNKEANQAIEELCLYTESYLRFRFPEISDGLRSRLVHANSERLRRLHYQMTHRRRIGFDVYKPEPHEPVKMPTAAISYTKPLEVRKKKDRTESVPKRVTTREERASTAQDSKARELYADSTISVPRAKSILVNSKLTFPPPPTSPECPYCSMIVESYSGGNTVEWK